MTRVLLFLVLCSGVPAFSQESTMETSVFQESFEGMFQSPEIPELPDLPQGVASPSPPVPLDRDLIVLTGVAFLLGLRYFRKNREIRA